MNEILIKSLVEKANAARQNARADYSGFAVGAALLCENESIITGCNVECSSYGLTICAERVALTKAISEGFSQFTAIAIVGPQNNYCPPCGACRQFLNDYAPNLTVILIQNNHAKRYKLSELLPIAFSPENLRRK